MSLDVSTARVPASRTMALFCLGVLVACGLVVGHAQPRLAKAYEHVRVTSDVYPLPSPEQTVIASLGYRAALADILFAHVLVSAGFHFKEKRHFEQVGRYLETINALAPKFGDPYRYADTLLTMQSTQVPREAYFEARRILRRGMKERPSDYRLWITAGQFLAYLAWPHVGDVDEQRRWRLEGARALASACGMIGDDEFLPFHCMTAAGQLSRAGEKAAIARFLERVLAISDDEEVRRYALAYLEAYVGERERQTAEKRIKRLEALQREDLPFVSKDLYLALGPPFVAAQCAGLERTHDARCGTTWATYLEADMDAAVAVPAPIASP